MFILLFIRDLTIQLYKRVKLQFPFILFLIIIFFVSIDLIVYLMQNFVFYVVIIFNEFILILHIILYFFIYNILIWFLTILHGLFFYFLSYFFIIIINIIFFYGFILEMFFYNSDIFMFGLKTININDFMLLNYIYIYNFGNLFVKYFILNILFLLKKYFYYFLFVVNLSIFLVFNILNFLYYYLQILITLEILIPIFIFIMYIVVYFYYIIDVMFWYISNLFKLSIIILIQLITFILRLIAPLDHGGTPLKPFPEIHNLIADISGTKIYYYPDIFRNFFMFLYKTLEIPVDIFICFNNVYINLSSFFLIFSYSFLLKQFNNLVYILAELNQLSWFDFFYYSVCAYILYIYIYINLSHFYVYLVVISLFSSWFIFKGWMDIQIERINFLGIFEILINFNRFLKFYILKYKVFIGFICIFLICLNFLSYILV